MGRRSTGARLNDAKRRDRATLDATDAAIASVANAPSKRMEAWRVELKDGVVTVKHGARVVPESGWTVWVRRCVRMVKAAASPYTRKTTSDTIFERGGNKR